MPPHTDPDYPPQLHLVAERRACQNSRAQRLCACYLDKVLGRAWRKTENLRMVTLFISRMRWDDEGLTIRIGPRISHGENPGTRKPQFWMDFVFASRVDLVIINYSKSPDDSTHNFWPYTLVPPLPVPVGSPVCIMKSYAEIRSRGPSHQGITLRLTAMIRWKTTPL
jgi:hypothetical protein